MNEKEREGTNNLYDTHNVETELLDEVLGKSLLVRMSCGKLFLFRLGIIN